MKKFLIVFLIMLFASSSYAGWTITVNEDGRVNLGTGEKLHRMKMTVTSDGGRPDTGNLIDSLQGDTTGEFLFTTFVSSGEGLIDGAKLYQIEIVPDATNPPPTVFDLKISSGEGALILNLNDISFGEAELHDVAGTFGGYPYIWDLEFLFEWLRFDTSDSVDVYIDLIK